MNLAAEDSKEDMTLAAQYKVVLEAKAKPNETAPKIAAVYDYAADFADFWEDGELPAPKIIEAASNSTSKALIIVWGGMPDDKTASDKLLMPHLTPLDWVLAFSMKILSIDKVPLENLGFSIHIIDLTVKEFEDTFALRMRDQLLAEMPWMKLYAPLVPKGKNNKPVRYRRGYERITDLNYFLEIDNKAYTMAASIEGQKDSIKGGLGVVANSWRASLVQSDDHHDVNNIIGPDILVRPDLRRKGFPGAFLSKLTWIGNDLKRVGKWNHWEAGTHIPKALFDRPLSVVVVDDQLNQGWGRFVCRLFNGDQFDEACDPKKSQFVKLNKGGNPTQKIKIYGCLSSQPAIDFLKTAYFDRRLFSQQVRVNDEIHPHPQPQLILLDLRLYEGITEARMQCEKLLEIVSSRVQGGLAWPAIDKAEIERITKWCKGESVDASVADEALLLLPRLLALALPLTPIILFSSTGQAWIKERLKPYQNIFTGFEKPRVLSNPESVQASITNLHDVLDKAVEMIHLRLQLAHVQYAAILADRDRPKKDIELIKNQHIEIYADETRTLEEGITSGIAVCVYPNKTSADVLQAKLEVEHRSSGVVWAKVDRTTNTKLDKGAVISKNPAKCTEQVGLLKNLLDEKDVGLEEENRKLWSVIATKVPKSKREKKPVSLAAFPDGPLDEALRFNLEFTLYVLMPYFSSDGNTRFGGTVHIYLPTRMVPYNNNEEDFATKLCAAFDLGPPRNKTNDNNENIFLVPTSSLSQGNSPLGTAFPLIRGWLHEWQKASHIPAERITSIKTTNLSRGTDKHNRLAPNEASRQRLLHDIADWACSASQIFNTHTLNTLKTTGLFPHWFISTDIKQNQFETDTKNAFLLMQALKASFFGDGSESDTFRLVLRNSYVDTCAERLLESPYCTQQRLILWMLRNKLDFARGLVLHSLLADAQQTVQPEPNNDINNDAEQQNETTFAISEIIESVDIGEDETPTDVLIEQTVLPKESIPEILDKEKLKACFPGCETYELVTITKFGDIFFKPVGCKEKRGTHKIHNQELACQFKAEGWSNPVIVFGMEAMCELTDDPVANIHIAATLPTEKSLQVFAAKLEDDRWKMISPSVPNNNRQSTLPQAEPPHPDANNQGAVVNYVPFDIRVTLKHFKNVDACTRQITQALLVPNTSDIIDGVMTRTTEGIKKIKFRVNKDRRGNLKIQFKICKTAQDNVERAFGSIENKDWVCFFDKIDP